MSPAENFGHHTEHNGDFQTVLTDAQGYTSSDYELEPAVNSYLNGDVNYTLQATTELFYAKLCQSSYSSNINRKQYITDRNQKLGDITNFNVMEKDPYSDISMVSYKNLTDDKYYIAFKGTSNLFDVFSDFNVFLDYTETMISPLDGLVTTYTPYIKGLLQSPYGYNLVLTGHSLGALVILNIISNLCQDSELTQSHLDRIEKCVCFAPYILRTQAYNYVHTACGDSNHPKQSYLKNLFEFHITDSDLASIIVRSKAGAFGNLIVYPNKTDGIVTTFLGESYANYNIYGNHTLVNWSNDQIPDEVVPTLQDDHIDKTIRCIKTTLLADHLLDNTVPQYPLLYNMGTDVADSTSDLRFAFSEQHTQYWKNYNWDLTPDPITGGYKTIEHLATVYMAFRYELRNNHTYTEVGGLTLIVYPFNHLNINTQYNFLVEQLDTNTSTYVTLGYLTIPNGDLNTLVGRHNLSTLKDTFAGQFHPNLVVSSQANYNERQTFEIGSPIPDPADASTVPYHDDLRRFINHIDVNPLANTPYSPLSNWNDKTYTIHPHSYETRSLQTYNGNGADTVTANIATWGTTVTPGNTWFFKNLDIVYTDDSATTIHYILADIESVEEIGFSIATNIPPLGDGNFYSTNYVNSIFNVVPQVKLVPATDLSGNYISDSFNIINNSANPLKHQDQWSTNGTDPVYWDDTTTITSSAVVRYMWKFVEV